MSSNTRRILCFICCLFPCRSSQDLGYTWTENEESVLKGQKLEGFVIMVRNGIHIPTQCAGHCLRNSECKSYNVDSSRKTCEINSATQLDGGKLVADIASNYYPRDAFTIDQVRAHLALHKT